MSPHFFKRKPVFVGQYGATLRVRLKPQCKFYKGTGAFISHLEKGIHSEALLP